MLEFGFQVQIWLNSNFKGPNSIKIVSLWGFFGPFCQFVFYSGYNRRFFEKKTRIILVKNIYYWLFKDWLVQNSSWANHYVQIRLSNLIEFDLKFEFQIRLYCSNSELFCVESEIRPSLVPTAKKCQSLFHNKKNCRPTDEKLEKNSIFINPNMTTAKRTMYAVQIICYNIEYFYGL